MKTIESVTAALESIERRIAENQARQTEILTAHIGKPVFASLEMGDLNLRMRQLKLDRTRALEDVESLGKS